MENKEIWKDIEGYEGLYQISSYGRVKSLKRYIRKKHSNEFLLSEVNDDKGYLMVHLRKPSSSKHIRIHRLVAQAFIPNPNNLPQVNHKDEDKTNNRVDNLEWCDAKYNLSYGTRQKREIKTQQQTHPSCKPVLQFTKDGDFIKKFISTKEVERNLNISCGGISLCCRDKLETSGGYKWGYAEDYERIPFKVFDIEMYRKKVA